MMNKRGGEEILMIYRIVIVTIVAFVILGTSSIIYNYTVNTRDTEGMLLGRTIMDCIGKDSSIDLDSMEDFKWDMFGYCDLNIEEEFAFVSLKFYRGEEELEKITGGDESLEWVRKIYTSNLKVESIKDYEPGYYHSRFPMIYYYNEEMIDGEVVLEVIINAQE
jgi:hypothetical protein